MFTASKPLENNIIWRKTVNMLPRNFTELEEKATTRCAGATAHQFDNGYWLKQKTQWQWVANGCLLQFLNRHEITNCFSRKYHGNVTLIGDSHLRYLYIYLQQETYDGEWSELRKHILMRNVTSTNTWTFRSLSYLKGGYAVHQHRLFCGSVSFVSHFFSK